MRPNKFFKLVQLRALGLGGQLKLHWRLILQWCWSNRSLQWSPSTNIRVVLPPAAHGKKLAACEQRLQFSTHKLMPATRSRHQFGTKRPKRSRRQPLVPCHPTRCSPAHQARRGGLLRLGTTSAELPVFIAAPRPHPPQLSWPWPFCRSWCDRIKHTGCQEASLDKGKRPRGRGFRLSLSLPAPAGAW